MAPVVSLGWETHRGWRFGPLTERCELCLSLVSVDHERWNIPATDNEAV